MKIVLYEHPTLRTKSTEVDTVDDELRKTLDEMVDIMRKANGVGLAANQVDIPKRFFVLEVENEVLILKYLKRVRKSSNMKKDV